MKWQVLKKNNRVLLGTITALLTFGMVTLSLAASSGFQKNNRVTRAKSVTKSSSRASTSRASSASRVSNSRASSTSKASSSKSLQSSSRQTSSRAARQSSVSSARQSISSARQAATSARQSARSARQSSNSISRNTSSRTTGSSSLSRNTSSRSSLGNSISNSSLRRNTISNSRSILGNSNNSSSNRTSNVSTSRVTNPLRSSSSIGSRSSLSISNPTRSVSSPPARSYGATTTTTTTTSNRTTFPARTTNTLTRNRAAGPGQSLIQNSSTSTQSSRQVEISRRSSPRPANATSPTSTANRSSSNGISLTAIAAAQRERASLQRRAPLPTVIANPVQAGFARRLMFVDSMRRSLRRISPQPVVYHETVYINQAPPAVIGGSVTAAPIYYDQWDYPYQGYPQDEYAYYEDYYNQGDYLENFGYSFDDQGSLYINPQDDYDPLLSGYYTEEGYVAPPAYLVGPGIEMNDNYPISLRYYGGYGFFGRMNGLMKSWMSPYQYHQSTYYWNRMGNFIQSDNGLKLTLSLLLPLGWF